MLELCNILDVTVNELLSGERIEMDNYEEKVSENLIKLKRKEIIVMLQAVKVKASFNQRETPEDATENSALASVWRNKRKYTMLSASTPES